MFFTSNLKYLIKKFNLNQAGLGERLGVKNTTISSWQVGKSYPTVETLIELSKLFDISIDDLFYKDIPNISEYEITNNLELKIEEATPQNEAVKDIDYLRQEIALLERLCQEKELVIKTKDQLIEHLLRVTGIKDSERGGG